MIDNDNNKSNDINENKLNIRKAKIEDLNALVNLRKEHFIYEIEILNNTLLDISWPESEDSREDLKYFILSEVIYIAEVGDVPVGYICGEVNFKKAWYKENIASLTNLFVKKEYRKKGIGKYLVDYFKDDVLSRGISKIEVNVMSNNISAIEFYEEYGFYNLSKQLILDV